MFLENLFRPFGWLILFDGDGGSGSGGGEPPAGKTFSQADVDRIMGETRETARKATENALLKSLGVESTDALKAIITAAKEADDKNKTELDKVRTDLVNKTKEFDELKTTSAATESALRSRILNASIKTIAASPVMDKDGKKVVRPAVRADALDDAVTLIHSDKALRELITEKDGEYSDIEKAVAKLVEAKPFLVQQVEKPNFKGTPSTDESKIKGKQPSQTQETVSQTIRF